VSPVRVTDVIYGLSPGCLPILTTAKSRARPSVFSGLRSADHRFQGDKQREGEHNDADEGDGEVNLMHAVYL
jgi:hypothetical protein